MSSSPFYFKKRASSADVDAQMIPCGTILDCNENPLLSKLGAATVIGSLPYTVLSTDFFISVRPTTLGSGTINLPAASTVSGRYFVIKDTEGGAGGKPITIDPNASELIDGATTYVMNTDWESLTIYSNGSAWFII
jgi:hypothetical protein